MSWQFWVPKDVMYVMKGEVPDNLTWINCSLYHNLTTTKHDNSGAGDNTWLGYVCCVIAVIGFGSNYVPVKRYPCGDGMFFQWIFCGFIMLVGFVVQMSMTNTTFYFLPMIGGAMWATGNIAVIPIIRCIGLSLGLCIWSCVNLLVGWASGRFGFFGVCPEVPSDPVMNYIGVAFSVIAVVTFVLVKPTLDDDLPITEPSPTVTSSSDSVTQYAAVTSGPIYQATERSSLLQSSVAVESDSERTNISQVSQNDDNAVMVIDKLNPFAKRFLGIFLCIFSGLVYGCNFAPSIYIQNHYVTVDHHLASQKGLDYVFPQYCGAYFASTLYFMIYCIALRNGQRLQSNLILPAFGSAFIWSLACTAWFVANEKLSEAVSFPLISATPGVVGSLWGVFMFGEIRGVRNFTILGIAFVFSFTGAIMTALSR